MGFDKDIYAYISIIIVKLKVLNRVNVFYALSAVFLIISIACSGPEYYYIAFFYLAPRHCSNESTKVQTLGPIC